MTTNRQGRAFTLVELILVIFIIALLTGMAYPLFSQLAKQSKVQQTVSAVETALFHARSEAQNLRSVVAVYYGDDLAGMGLEPSPNPVPKKGQIEVWAVQATTGFGFGGYGDVRPVISPSVSGADQWYPFRFPTMMITKQPITFPDGVRIMAGSFSRSLSGGVYRCIFDFPKYRKDQIGEIKRHHTVFSQRGGLVQQVTGSGCYAYDFILIYEEATGQHVVMEAGRSHSATRPRVLPYVLTHIRENPSSGPTTADAVTDWRQINSRINAYPGNL